MDEGDDDSVPVTSLPCQWRAPKKPKESVLPIAEARFEKHDYTKPTKQRVKLLENFDPRPPEFRGNAASRLPDFLDKVRGEQLGYLIAVFVSRQMSNKQCLIPSPAQKNCRKL